MYTEYRSKTYKGYYIQDLDKRPSMVLRAASEFTCAKEGTKELSRMASEERVWFDELMNRMAAKILLSNIDMLLIFRNYDKSAQLIFDSFCDVS